MSQAPVYTREELERKLDKLHGEIRRLTVHLDARRKLEQAIAELWRAGAISSETYERVVKALDDLEATVCDAIGEIIVNELKLDDIERHDFKLEYESERLLGYEAVRVPLGVAMLRAGNTTHTIVIWTDCITVGYYILH